MLTLSSLSPRRRSPLQTPAANGVLRLPALPRGWLQVLGFLQSHFRTDNFLEQLRELKSLYLGRQFIIKDTHQEWEGTQGWWAGSRVQEPLFHGVGVAILPARGCKPLSLRFRSFHLRRHDWLNHWSQGTELPISFPSPGWGMALKVPTL